jgi:hypothetical protein
MRFLFLLPTWAMICFEPVNAINQDLAAVVRAKNRAIPARKDDDSAAGSVLIEKAGE